MKKEVFCVETRFYDDGKVEVGIYQCNLAEKPQNTNRQTALADVYEDWFEHRCDAERFAAEAKAA